MVSFTTPAFILRSVDVGVKDRIYSLYTRDRGKIDVLAKGIRKADSKLQSSMQVAALLEVYVIAQRRFTLGGSIIREADPELLHSLPRLWAFQHALDVVNRLTQQEHIDVALFERLERFFLTLRDHSDAAPERLLYATVSFDLHVLHVLGHAPRLRTNEKDDTFSALRSDGLHRFSDVAHQPYRKISTETRSLLRFAQQKEPSDCFRVGISLVQAIDQHACMRVLLEDYDAANLASDCTMKDFLFQK